MNGGDDGGRKIVGELFAFRFDDAERAIELVDTTQLASGDAPNCWSVDCSGGGQSFVASALMNGGGGDASFASILTLDGYLAEKKAIEARDAEWREAQRQRKRDELAQILAFNRQAIERM